MARPPIAQLLEYVHEIPGIERIRYTTSHPKEFGQRLIDAYARLPKLAGHVHLPVQAGADRILAAMKRGYTVLQYKSIIRRLRAARPGISISSDFIVGFPGETEEDFERTMRLAADVGFDASFSFVYSRRPGTPAADLADDTPPAIKLARLQRLQAAIDESSGRSRAALVGSTQRILVEGASKKEAAALTGRTENNRELHRQGITGQGVNVAIIDYYTFTDHQEFAGQFAGYLDLSQAGRDPEAEARGGVVDRVVQKFTGRRASMHGPAVASLLVGDHCGTAPGARLYFVATPDPGGDSRWQARSLDWILAQNRQLPPARKIRVVSISVSPSGKNIDACGTVICGTRQSRAPKTAGFWLWTRPSNTDSLAPAIWIPPHRKT